MTNIQKSSKSKASTKALITKIFLLLCLIAALVYQTTNQNEQAPKMDFMNIKGEKITAESLIGKVFIVNFWATSCTTCVAEMPEMIATYNQFHGKGLEFIAVAMSYDPPNYVVNFAETRQLPFHVVLDLEGKIAKAYGDIKLTPTTFVIDKDGSILKRYIGKPSFEELHQLLETKLSK
jgi:peroxiredoxin